MAYRRNAAYGEPGSLAHAAGIAAFKPDILIGLDEFGVELAVACDQDKSAAARSGLEPGLLALPLMTGLPPVPRCGRR